MKTIREREAERRALKLAEVGRQVAEGSLVIRQMTPAERLAYPPPTRPARTGRR